MTCREIEPFLIPYANGEAIPPEVAAHIAGCESCRRLVAALGQRKPSEAPPAPELDRIKARMRANLRPIKPLPPSGVFVLGFLLIAAAAVAIGVAHLGTAGWEALGALRRTAVFTVLAGGFGLLSLLLARQIVPGSRVLLPPSLAMSGILAILAAIFDTLFQFHAEKTFVATGLACLEIGLECALPVAAITWLILQRGLVLRPALAGALTGAVAGLAGLALLETFCPNPDKYHILVWHIGAALASTALGAVAGWMAGRFQTRFPHD